jgi:hypothetical protein
MTVVMVVMNGGEMLQRWCTCIRQHLKKTSIQQYHGIYTPSLDLMLNFSFTILFSIFLNWYCCTTCSMCMMMYVSLLSLHLCYCYSPALFIVRTLAWPVCAQHRVAAAFTSIPRSDTCHTTQCTNNCRRRPTFHAIPRHRPAAVSRHRAP